MFILTILKSIVVLIGLALTGFYVIEGFREKKRFKKAILVFLGAFGILILLAGIEFAIASN